MSRRAVIAVTRTLNEGKQLAAVLEYARDHDLDVVSFTREPEAAIAAVEAGLADLVLAAVVDERRVLQHAGVPVTFLREPHGDPHRKIIEEMLARGGDVATVARLLDLPVRQVEAVAAGDKVVHPRYAPARQVHVVRRAERVR